jgi:hypothetical protein
MDVSFVGAGVLRPVRDELPGRTSHFGGFRAPRPATDPGIPYFHGVHTGARVYDISTDERVRREVP